MTGCAGSAIGEPSLLWICQPQGRPPRPSFTMSAPVKTATTPGIFAAAAMSTELIRAWACGLRRIQACNCPWRLKSSV